MMMLLKHSFRNLALWSLALCATVATADEPNAFTGGVDGNWFEAGNWSKAAVPTADDDVLIDGKAVVAEGSIVARKLTITGASASLTLGKDDHSLNIAANIASNLLVTGGATLSVYPGELADYSTVFSTFTVGTKALYDNANIVSIGGSFTVGTGSTVYPSNAKTSGTPVFFKAVGEVTVEEGATFDVCKRGWMWSDETPTPAGGCVASPNGNGWWSFSPGLGISWSAAAGYGGKGGGANASFGKTYGLDVAPLLSGAPAGVSYNVKTEQAKLDSRATGSICIMSAGRVCIAGTLNANGQGSSATGTSGGGIWLVGSPVRLEPTAVLTAKGAGGWQNHPAGGGGRIAIAQGMSEDDLADLAAGTGVEGAEVVDLVHDGVTVAGGANTAETKKAGAVGTAKQVTKITSFARIEVRSQPVVVQGLDVGVEDRLVGLNTFAAPMNAADVSDPTAVYTCYGYVVTCAFGEVARGVGNVCTLEIEHAAEPYVITWQWGAREDVLAVEGVPNGVAAAPGFGIDTAVAAGATKPCSVSASYEDDETLVRKSCTGWTLYDKNGVVVDSGEGNSFSYTHPTPSAYRRLVWEWETVAVPNAFTGEVDGDWFTADNWSKKTVPTADDDVLIADQDVTAEGSIAARRLTINGMSASLSLGKDDHSLNIAANIASNLLVTGGATFSVYPGELDDYSTVFADKAKGYYALYTNANVIAIGGTFTVANGATVYPSNAKISGTPVFFKAAGDVIVEEGATFDSRKRGWMWIASATRPSGCLEWKTAWWTLSPGGGSDYTAGGGYGGRSGAAVTYGKTYGLESAPFLSGSPAGISYNASGEQPLIDSRATGSICLFSKGCVCVAGTLNADSMGSSASHSSGGGIWVVGGRVCLEPTAVLTANGGVGWKNHAAGGAGRIAVAQGLSDGELADLAAGKTVDGVEVLDLVRDGVSVVGGANPGGSTIGYAGTKKLVQMANAFAEVTVCGSPVAAVGPVYDTWAYPVGQNVFTAPMRATDLDDPTKGYVCYGAVVSDRNGEVLRSFSNVCTVTLDAGAEPYTLTWQWGESEDVLVVDGAPAEGAEVGVYPAYGVRPDMSTERSIVCTAPVLWSNDAALMDAQCIGWKLYDINGTVVDSGEGTTCSYVHPTPAAYRRLVWQWKTSFDANVFTGEVDDDWFTADNWSKKTVPTADDDVLIDGKAVVAEGSIAARRLTINGGLASLTLGKDDHSLNIAANIASNLLVTGGATFSVYPGEFDYSTIFATFADGMYANYTNANVIAIGGSFTVKVGSTVYPSNAKTSGTPVFFKAAGDVTVEEGATFDVRKRGWMWSSEKPMPSGGITPKGGNGWWSFSPGCGFSWTVGAGYGGKGVGNTYGLAYGLANAPFLSGAPAGVVYNGTKESLKVDSRATGSICLFSEGRIRIAGTLNADYLGDSSSGTSGGGIWVVGGSVQLDSTAVLTAKGRDGAQNHPAGGGGRIAVVQGLSAEEVDDLVDGKAIEGVEIVDLVNDGVSVKGGYYAASSGGNGTAKLISKPSAFATVEVCSEPIVVRGLDVGVQNYPVGVVSFEAPKESVDPANPDASQYVCTGYVVSNATGEVTRGDSNACSFELVNELSPYQLTWQWKLQKVRLSVGIPSAEQGTLSLDGVVQTEPVSKWIPGGSSLTISVVPADGMAFNCWQGAVPRGSERTATLSLPVTEPLTLRPVLYAVGDPQTRTWIADRVGDFYDADNWTDGVVPSPVDDAVIASGLCSAKYALTLGSLTLEGGELDVSEAASVTIANDLTLNGTAKMTVAAISTDAARTYATGTTVVSVGGDLVMNDSAVLRPVCDSWTGGAPVFWVGKRFVLAEGATVDAREAGWAWQRYAAVPSPLATYTTAADGVPFQTMALAPGVTDAVGASHGGLGAGTAAKDAYGFVHAPIYPGSPNGVYAVDTALPGGGVVRIHAGKAQVDGTIDASARLAGTTPVARGGASGGSIWLTADKFAFGDGAQLLVKGGLSNLTTSEGGAGRIAVWTGLSAEQILRLAQTGLSGRKGKGVEAFLSDFPSVTVDLSRGNAGSTVETDVNGSFSYSLFRGLLIMVR